MTQKYTIEIDTSKSSDVARVELHWEIEAFLLWLTAFDYHTLSVNRITGDNSYYSKSIN